MLPSPKVKEVHLKDYLKVIQKRYWVILSFSFVLVTTVMVLTFRMTPIYRATVSIIIEKTPPKIVSIEDVYQAGIADKEYYETQYKILGSRALAKMVFDELNLARDPEFFKKTKDPIDVVLSHLIVEPIKETRMVKLSFESMDPIKSARIANTFARLYIRQDVETKRSASRYATGWLEEQLNEMKKKLEAAEVNLNNYIQEHKIVTIPNLQEESQSLLETLKKEEARLETQIKEASQRYKEKHPKMVTLNSELESVREKIKLETERLLDLNQKMIQYNILKREVESNRQLYDSLLKRTKETTVSEELQAAQIRIVDPAEVPISPIKPRKMQNFILACILGLSLGVGLAFFLEYLDSTVKTAEDIEFYVKLPFLGYVPSVRRQIEMKKEMDLYCYENTTTKIAEAYRSIRTSIIFSSPEERPLKSILITSSIPQEGKTSVTVNLATVFTQKNERVIILEADMRKPRIAKSFDLDNKEGLSSFLAGSIEFEKIIKKTFIPNLFLIPAGPVPPNPAELLTSIKLKWIFDELNKKFERIIIDSPPVLTVADAAILANIIDSVIIVIRAGFVSLEPILRAKQRLLEAKARIIGVILNNVEVKKEDSSYYYHYYYPEDKKEKLLAI
ncbi:MAG: polysaccharide biosynthesis tyrosine autokinase [Candidatus Omnitrophica bacterium]|nr:polysaccharide biosynthesis tyrosine autokinase [Candidatus Omnitrophota bacterium]